MSCEALKNKKKRGGASGDYSSLNIQVVRYAEQSFAHCHTVITLSLCTLLLQNISIVGNLNVMHVLFEHTKRFSQWHTALPADCVWGGHVQKVKSISIRVTESHLTGFLFSLAWLKSGQAPMKNKAVHAGNKQHTHRVRRERGVYAGMAVN